jgi:hypothetical protein
MMRAAISINFPALAHCALCAAALLDALDAGSYPEAENRTLGAVGAVDGMAPDVVGMGAAAGRGFLSATGVLAVVDWIGRGIFNPLIFPEMGFESAIGSALRHRVLL